MKKQLSEGEKAEVKFNRVFRDKKIPVLEEENKSVGIHKNNL